MAGIVAVVVLFLGAVALLYWRAAATQAATALIVVETDETLEGAIVTVAAAEDGRVVSSGPVVRQKNSFYCRTVVAPGTYWLRVTHRGQDVHQTNPTRIGEYQIGHLKLPLPNAPGQPASPSATRASPSGGGGEGRP